MQVLLASDRDLTTNKVRQILLRKGLDCPVSSVVSVDLAAIHLVHEQPELVVLVLPADAERGLAVLAEIRWKTRAHVLAVGPAGDSRQVLRTLRAGADDYVHESDIEEELEAFLVRWSAGRGAQAEAGRLIAVLAPSGGSGSSTLAANVATVLAKEHQKSLLVDMKLQAGDLAALLDLKPIHTLADLCHDVSRMDRELFQRTLAAHPSGVHLLAPPHTLADAGRVGPEGIRQALALGRAAFPYVVVDLDRSFREEQAMVLRQADIILLVTRLDFASLRNARRALDYFRESAIEEERVRLVVNRHGQPQEVPASMAVEALGMKIFHFVPEDAKAINRSNNNGVPVVLGAPSAKVSKSVTKLAMSVNGQHKPH
jgi:pilus assembly protein CpaE